MGSRSGYHHQKNTTIISNAESAISRSALDRVQQHAQPPCALKALKVKVFGDHVQCTGNYSVHRRVGHPSVQHLSLCPCFSPLKEPTADGYQRFKLTRPPPATPKRKVLWSP